MKLRKASPFGYLLLVRVCVCVFVKNETAESILILYLYCVYSVHPVPTLYRICRVFGRMIYVVYPYHPEVHTPHKHIYTHTHAHCLWIEKLICAYSLFCWFRSSIRQFVVRRSSHVSNGSVNRFRYVNDNVRNSDNVLFIYTKFPNRSLLEFLALLAARSKQNMPR